MITFILPGGSETNKEWLEECAASLKVDGIIRPIYWDHWTDSSQKFDKKEKAVLIARHTKGDKINIVAKSIGSLVAAHIIELIPNQINKVIIAGLPLNDISTEEKVVIKQALSSLPKDKLVCFQNSKDPHGTFTEAKEFVPDGVKIIEKDRDDHTYPFYEDFNNFLA